MAGALAGRGAEWRPHHHIGTDDHYIALYTGGNVPYGPDIFAKGRPLNHVGILVDDLDATEERVVAFGLEPFSHGDYEAGRRFYFFDPDGIEYEVISYAPAAAETAVVEPSAPQPA